jgi:hypothetical protein
VDAARRSCLIASGLTADISALYNRSRPSLPRFATSTRMSCTLPRTNHQHFQAYQPLLPRYPQLVSPTLLTSSLPQYAFPNSSPSRAKSDGMRDIDTALLGSIVLTRRLRKEPDLVICAAEAGGGTCADSGCQNLHLSRDRPVGESLSRQVRWVGTAVN